MSKQYCIHMFSSPFSYFCLTLKSMLALRHTFMFRSNINFIERSV